MLDRLFAQAKLEGVIVQVLRYSLAATAAQKGLSEMMIAGVLEHTVLSVTGRYPHVADSALVAAADRVSARIVAALEDKIDAAKIVQLKTRAGKR